MTVVARSSNQRMLKLLAHQILKHPVITKSIKGFSLAYLYVILPRLLSIFTRAIKRKESVHDVIRKVAKAVRRGFLPNRFPMFIGKLIGGVFLLETVFGNRTTRSVQAASFLSGLFAFSQYKSSLKAHPAGPDTSDLTLVVFVRAVDYITRSAYNKLRVPGKVQQMSDVGLFTCSCFAIMFAWFYYPERLPVSYRKWITMAANMDDELVEALKLLRNGEIVYGTRGPHDDILCNMCQKSGMPASAGRFSEAIPLPCRLVHNNVTDNCELHALWRWYRGFFTALPIYLPLNLAIVIGGRKWRTGWKHALISSTRSSAFLATFIMLCWYGVCLVRTRIGPKLFPKATAQQLEDTYGPGLGSALCGMSSLIEYPKRRGELALFVAPRALSIAIEDKTKVSPRLESLIFALSFATLVGGIKSNRSNVRGVFGRLMGAVF